MTESPTDALTGRIFDIQHCSLDDGPGIRTAVFFKGCPLNCQWCHNPESLDPRPVLAYKNNLCRFCRLCADVCGPEAHRFSVRGGYEVHEVLYDRCTGCGECIKVCCYEALEMVGRDFTVGELFKEIQIDIPYFSIGEGGGITFTGGEPALQVGFIESFLAQYGEFHTCMETSGFAPQDNFRRLLPLIDLFLFDFKVTDREKHRELCGVYNDKILENFEFLYRNDASIVLRFPLIPGVNDDDDHLKSIVQLLDRHPKVSYGQIMPYHNLGVGKQSIYPVNNILQDLPSTGEDQKRIWIEKLRSFGARNIRIS